LHNAELADTGRDHREVLGASGHVADHDRVVRGDQRLAVGEHDPPIAGHADAVVVAVAEYDLADLRRQFSPAATAVAPSTTITAETPTITLAPSNADTTVPEITPPSTTIPSSTQTTTGG